MIIYMLIYIYLHVDTYMCHGYVHIIGMMISTLFYLSWFFE